MLRHALGLSATVVASVFLCSCSSEPPTIDEKVAQSADEIVGGSPDTTNQAVVYVQGGGGACTATIVAKNGSNGYALTAAHCVGGGGPDTLWIGNNLNNPTAVHNIVDVQVHPSYNGNPGAGYDFAMLRFTGATAATPVIPAASPAEDNLTIGSQIEHVGYGLYNSGGNLFQSDIRRHAFGNVDGLNSLIIDYDQQWSGNPGGPCSGDSGGPQLAGGRVVGVTSYGDQNCQQYGASGRVSAVYNSFIAPFIGGQPTQETCDECAASSQNPGGACAAAVDACAANQQCVDLVGCINGCGSSQCIQNCANQYPNGVASYNALIDCICDVGCPTECATECGGSSSTTTGTGGPSGVTTATTGAGGATGVGGAGSGQPKADDDDDANTKTSGCSMGAPADAGLPPWALVALMGAAALVRRRRHG